MEGRGKTIGKEVSEALGVKCYDKGTSDRSSKAQWSLRGIIRDP